MRWLHSFWRHGRITGKWSIESTPFLMFSLWFFFLFQRSFCLNIDPVTLLGGVWGQAAHGWHPGLDSVIGHTENLPGGLGPSGCMSKAAAAAGLLHEPVPLTRPLRSRPAIQLNFIAWPLGLRGEDEVSWLWRGGAGEKAPSPLVRIGVTTDADTTDCRKMECCFSQFTTVCHII